MGRSGRRIPPGAAVAGRRRAGEWVDFRRRLTGNVTSSVWEEVWDSWYYPRLRGRFLVPAESLAASGQKEGEGFAITLILCVLIEFVEASLQGRLFAVRDGDDLGPFEYRSSRQLFVDFLTSEWKMGRPLTKALAQDFFDNVRSGLVHEAATRSNALIRARSCGDGGKAFYNEMVSSQDKWLVCHRDELLEAIKSLLGNYKRKIVAGEGAYRENLFRVLDHACGVDRVFYFAYGSNMLREQFEGERSIHVHHSWNDVVIEGYRLAFNKRSKKHPDRTYANIVEAGSDYSVRGVLFEIDQGELTRLHKDYEGGYDEAVVKVRLHDDSPTAFAARTFAACGASCSDIVRPSDEYVDKVVRGALAGGLPEDYIAQIRLAARRPSDSAPAC